MQQWQWKIAEVLRPFDSPARADSLRVTTRCALAQNDEIEEQRPPGGEGIGGLGVFSSPAGVDLVRVPLLCVCELRSL
jgi:hypothetical protein